MGAHMHPEITMHTHPLGVYMPAIRAGDWRTVADLMLSSARILAGAGADVLLSPDNTIHEAMPLVRDASPLPWLHIAESVARQARARGFSRLAITGTTYLMTGPVYPETLGRFGLACEIPGAEDRETINRIIFDQLVYGDIREESRRAFNAIYGRMKARGCDAAVLGCTEIPLLVDPDDCPLPTLDSTRLLARAAIEEALCPA
jgi:aspartate racemase